MTNLTPPHAAKVWATSDNLFVELPNPDGKTCHLLKLPLDEYGMRQLFNILQARSHKSKLGEEGDKTQYQSDRDIKEMKALAKGFKGKVKKKVVIVADPEMRMTINDILRKEGIV